MQAPLEIKLIDTNNHSPQFSEPVYYFRVMENDLSGQLGQVVGTVGATDRDAGDNGRVTYHLTSRNAQGRFKIVEVCTFYIFVKFYGRCQNSTEDVVTNLLLKLVTSSNHMLGLKIS